MRAPIDTDPRWDDLHDRPGTGLEAEPPPAISVVGQAGPVTLRSWLVRGMRPASADPRRRRGRHADARRLLAADQRWSSPVGIWQDLVSALHRQTARTALERLDESDRKILMLAYWEGRSNAEIAALLHVSVSTVRRRLAAALERVDDALRRAGTWVSVTALLLLAFVARRAGLERTMTLRNAAVAAAGTAAVLTVGVLVTGPAPPVAMPAQAAAPNQGVTIALPTSLDRTSAGPISTENELQVPGVLVVAAGRPAVNSGASSQKGCGGNPTDAAPGTPVGSPTGHPTGSPVTHPGAGGCGPH